MTFEEMLARLESIVDELDGSERTLDEALALFREGVDHLRTAVAELDRADATIKLLAETEDGGFELRDREG